MTLSTIANAFSTIPVSVNGNYGDALQPSQWRDSLNKLESLAKSNHQGHVMIPTKYVPTREQIDVIAKNFPNTWIFMAITGLNESRLFTTEQYLASYLKVSDHLKNVVCAIRPIMPGHNDKFDVLKPILDTVARGKRLLTYSGYRDPMISGSPKFEAQEIGLQIEEYAATKDIVVAKKCACIIAKSTNSACAIHDLGAPRNLELLRQIGYNLRENDGQLYLDEMSNEISKGDVEFVRMIANQKPIVHTRNNSEIMSVALKNGTKLVTTSSWFQWSTQKHCVVGCSYCFADYKSLVRIDLPSFGCNPVELQELMMR